jgi:hypothetical protein
MQALDNFISLIPSFDNDIQISIILILAWPPRDESVSDAFVGASASASKTANPTP